MFIKSWFVLEQGLFANFFWLLRSATTLWVTYSKPRPFALLTSTRVFQAGSGCLKHQESSHKLLFPGTREAETSGSSGKETWGRSHSSCHGSCERHAAFGRLQSLQHSTRHRSCRNDVITGDSQGASDRGSQAEAGSSWLVETGEPNWWGSFDEQASSFSSQVEFLCRISNWLILICGALV